MALTNQYPHLITTSIQKLSKVSLPFCRKLESMDQVKSLKIAALTRSIKTHNYLINLTLLLFSIYVFSSFFFPTFLLALLHHFKFFFSTFLFQLFTHTIDKNCMFLLCNGLLVFVGITRSLSGCSGVDEPSKYIQDGSQFQYSDVEGNKPMLEKEVKEKTSEPDEHTNEAEKAIEIKYSGEEEEEENIILEDDEEGKGSSQSVLKEDELSEEETGLLDAGEEEEDKGSEIDEFLIEENVEEEMIVEEENWVLSTEELNKKFDDFIRRMKDDLRVEAQGRIVMV